MTKVYIIFGDEPRSDGDNIEAIFNTRMGAEEHIEMLERKYGDYTDYHIEEFEVFDDLKIIHCNDCEYSDNVVHDKHGNEYLVCLQHDCLVSRDEYCSRAKRCKRP